MKIAAFWIIPKKNDQNYAKVRALGNLNLNFEISNRLFAAQDLLGVAHGEVLARGVDHLRAEHLGLLPLDLLPELVELRRARRQRADRRRRGRREGLS